MMVTLWPECKLLLWFVTKVAAAQQKFHNLTLNSAHIWLLSESDQFALTFKCDKQEKGQGSQINLKEKT